ncbi:MAG: GTPase ObgE [Chloroflexota bacterium]|nr:GTPase ObgE [Chloroflexota bacterium]MDE3267506.1 GTPase ObgE [Chloroflexota bacterium]
MIDTATIVVKGGKGGTGVVSFRREKYVPRGGPDGGDGGAGGDVLLEAQSGHHLLQVFRSRKYFSARDGHNGQSGDKTGRAGEAHVIGVPVGTLVTRRTSGGDRTLLADLTEVGATALVARGGRGGRGNARFAHAQNRVPVLAEDGEIPCEVTLELELQLLADVAIMGMPSVGKSSLLRASTRAHPEVAAYPFTTLEPVLGFVIGQERDFVLVEIPGLLEGAHRGVGLGSDFLRHAERVKTVIHLIDGAAEDPVGDYIRIREEMRLHGGTLAGKPEIVAVNKMDVPEAEARREEIESSLRARGVRPSFISAAGEVGVGDLLLRVEQMLADHAVPTPAQAQPPAVVLTPQPVGPRVSVERDGDVFVLRADRAERIVRRVNLDDWMVQVQLWGELRRMGAVRALERAGARAGTTVRVGDWELEWK